MGTRTWQQHLAQATQQLADADVAAADHDVRVLLAHHLGCALNQLHGHLQETPQDTQAFQTLIDRRTAREPLAHITGTRGFWSLDLKVTSDVLDPRPDTETLIEAVLKHTADKQAPLRLLDIGTGSGAIALTLLTELPNATAHATDISPKALAIAKTNATKNKLADRITFVETSWATGIEGSFDIIVSNPPYIESAVIQTLDEEVKAHEPHLALDGGTDGLDAYRAILQQLNQVARADTLVAFEIGYDKSESVLALCERAGLEHLKLAQDLGGQNRTITGFFKG